VASVHRDVFDVGVAVGLGALAVISLAIGSDPDIYGPELADYARPAGYLLLVASIAPLAVRRRYPLTVLVVVTGAVVAMRIIEVPEFTASALAVYIAFYTAGAYGGARRTAVLSLAATAVGALLVWDIARTAEDAPDGKLVLLTVFTVAINVVQIAVSWYLGENVRRRRAREAELELQAQGCATPPNVRPARPCSRHGFASRASCMTCSPITCRSWASRPGRRGGSWSASPTRRSSC
jgi:hypothetical protein